MIVWIVVIGGGVALLIALGVAIGMESETESLLRRRQETSRESQRLQEERGLLDEAAERFRIERHKLQRAHKLYGAPRCPDCPYRDQLG